MANRDRALRLAESGLSANTDGHSRHARQAAGHRRDAWSNGTSSTAVADERNRIAVGGMAILRNVMPRTIAWLPCIDAVHISPNDHAL